MFADPPFLQHVHKQAVKPSPQGDRGDGEHPSRQYEAARIGHGAVIEMIGEEEDDGDQRDQKGDGHRAHGLGEAVQEVAGPLTVVASPEVGDDDDADDEDEGQGQVG